MRVPWCQPSSYGMGKRNSNFQFRFSFTHDVGNGNSNSYFRCPRQIGTSIFVFRFSITSYSTIAIAISIFHLLFSYGMEGKTEFERLSFLVSCSIMLFQDSGLLKYACFPPRLRSPKCMQRTAHTEL